MDFISIHTIVCPYCNVKQTGIVRMYNMETEKHVVEGDDDYKSEYVWAGIKCSWSKCAIIIRGLYLDRVTQKAINSPMDFKS
jgi:hypothetical protein